RFEFLSVLLDDLTNKNHDLLRDEIVSVVYQIASVNFESFYNTMVPAYLAKLNRIDENQKETIRRNYKSDSVNSGLLNLFFVTICPCHKSLYFITLIWFYLQDFPTFQ